MPVCAAVYLAMAVGADGAHKARVIWSAICQTTNVVTEKNSTIIFPPQFMTTVQEAIAMLNKDSASKEAD